MRDPEQNQQRWRQRIEAQQSSGLSVFDFCQREGIGRAGFYYWKRRVRPTSVTEGFIELKADSTREVAAQVVPPRQDSPPAIELRLANGRALMVPAGFDADHLAKLMVVAEAIG